MIRKLLFKIVRRLYKRKNIVVERFTPEECKFHLESYAHYSRHLTALQNKELMIPNMEEPISLMFLKAALDHYSNHLITQYKAHWPAGEPEEKKRTTH
jgi:hypothetical protein